MKYLIAAATAVVMTTAAIAQVEVFYQTFTPATLYNAYGSAGGRTTAAQDLNAEGWEISGEVTGTAALWSATRFVPTQSFTLSSITIPLITASRFDQADVNARMGLLWFGIYSDSGGAPGTSLFKLTNPTVGQIASYDNGTLIGSEFTADSTFVFSSGQTYWIVLGPDFDAITPSHGSTSWAWRAFRPPSSDGRGSMTSTSAAPTFTDWTTFASTGTYNTAFDNPGPDATVYTDWEGAMMVTGISAIPEPSTYAAILGAATIGLVALRRRKQKA